MLCVGEIMSLIDFAERNQIWPRLRRAIWPRLRRAMLIFWLPLVLLAAVPVGIVLFPSILDIIPTIIIGFMAGIIARLLHPVPNNDPMDRAFTHLLGIAGAFIATVIAPLIAGYRLDQSTTLISAAIGATIVMFIWSRLPHHATRRGPTP
jgi:uncharacterized membrane protein YeaQ/YmgE (transglycosylase-associated protein family)